MAKLAVLGATGLKSYVVKLAAGAAIPSFATITFNFLNIFFENYQKPSMEINPSAWDIAAGCALTTLGVAITVKDGTTKSEIFLISFFLILLIIGMEFLLPSFYHWNRLYSVFAVDFVAFVTLAWTISKAE